jgi:hypothetical protein
MTTPRAFHTATLLTNGKVLITGGGGGIIPCCLASAELYDPSTGIFTNTGSMTAPRSRHTATLLPSGQVLIAGGDSNGGSAELYDPATGTFSAIGNMTSARGVDPATLLPDGRVLFAASGELYDSSTGTFASTGMPDFRVETATLLPNGKVLVTASNLAELYDPATGTFTRTGDMIAPSPGPLPAAVLLANGKVLIAGGNLDEFGGTTSAEIYDPATGVFTATGRMTAAIDIWLAAALLPDGKVLISGESRDNGCLVTPDGGFCLGTSELYDPAAGTFSSPGYSQSEEGHAETLLPDGTVLISGGWYYCSFRFMPPNCGGTLANAQIYHPGVLVPAPRLFSISGDGRGQGAIWHSSTGEIASSASPAIAREALSLYTTSLVDGGALPPQVIVGGRLAEILYFGAAPGYPGYNQVNFRVPAGVAPASAVPVRLNYIGRASNAVTIGVR